MPPPVETAHFASAVLGNGTTKTSIGPDSFELYASHRPFGEMAGAFSVNLVATNGTATVSIPGRIPRMSPAPGLYLSVRKTSHLPSGDQRGLKAPRLSCSCNTACLLPSARFVHTSSEPAAFEVKVTDLPSGVHAL